MQILCKNDLIYNTLLERIKSGVYPIGYKFPPELEFSRELRIAKVTLRAALARLEHENVVVRMRGKGTFVANSEPMLSVCNLLVVSGNNAIGSPMPYLMNLLSKSAVKRGIVLEYIDSAIFETLPEKILKKLMDAKKIEGVLMMNSMFTGHEQSALRLRALKLPVVLPHGDIGDANRTGFATVTVDKRKAFGDTIEYVLEKGFQRVAVIGLSEYNFRGYTEKNIRMMLKDKLHSMTYVPYSLDSMDCTIKKIYNQSGPKPDIFVCYSDLMAILLIAVLDKMGLKVPNNVSVVGYSGLTCDFEPGLKLTGCKYRYSEMVETALDLMSRHADWYSPLHSYTAPEINIPVDFIEGDSVRK